MRNVTKCSTSSTVLKDSCEQNTFDYITSPVGGTPDLRLGFYSQVAKKVH